MRIALTAVALAAIVVSSATTWAAAETVGRPTVLKIEVLAEPGAKPSKHTLTCHPTGGNHPNADAACRRLNNLHGDPFQPVPPGSFCTMIYGGPQRATVKGIARGKPVAARFDRTNGCEIARWDALVPVLPEADETVSR
ncbi:MAG: hypothetical protein GEU86_22580 [Actinophytocola sp.]|nr:hypothetical protein [Actinophytocola sp.]